jgi:hypothetical protein
MTPNIKKRLKQKSCIGKWTTFHSKDDKDYEYRGICIDEVIEFSNDYAHRLQKIIWCQEYNRKKQKWVNLRINQLEPAIRACYFVIDQKRERIIFGQFSLSSNPKVVGSLFKKANRKGFFKKRSQKQLRKEVLRFI